MPRMTRVRFDHITKRFGHTVALDDINLEIRPGELFFLLGPSGCGKSTLLRLVAGLHEPTAGRVWFNDRDVTALGTEKRNAVMCFQSYALWPHMSVAENVRFGLKVRGMSRADQDARLAEVLRLVQMDAYADRKPNQLSGGQQQRVALARALAVNPDCLLLDEPLSNLDAKLRHEMRGEIRRICKTAGEGGFTTIYVTHDQKEALSVADRIAVLRAGKLVQVGTPGELYHKPVDSFVADFIGHTNLIPGTITARAGALLHLSTPAGPVLATAANFANSGNGDGNGDGPPAGGFPVAVASPEVFISIRPEQMRVAARNGDADPTPRPNRFLGRVVETTFLGEASEHVLEVGPQRLKVVSAPPMFDVHSEMAVEFDPQDVVVLSR
jgi:iron(III) transport system ATP-binding protein